jgi:hypothetical protein
MRVAPEGVMGLSEAMNRAMIQHLKATAMAERPIEEKLAILRLCLAELPRSNITPKIIALIQDLQDMMEPDPAD